MEAGNVSVRNELDGHKRMKEVNMKKGIILTLGMLLTAVLLTAGLFGCSSGNPTGTNPPKIGRAHV